MGVKLPFVGALALVCLAAFAATALAHPGHEAGLIDADALESRGPIVIDGNADFTPANGVRYGSGTAEDPFVIENWTLTGSGLAGLLITNTTSDYLIRNVLIDGNASADFTDGVRIVNVTGGMVDASEITEQARYGVYIGDSEAVDVCDVVTDRNGWIGVYAHASNNMTWRKSAAHDNDRHGFYLANDSVGNRITLSYAEGHANWGDQSYGIYSGLGADDNTFDNNTLHRNGAGIQVNQVTRNVIRDNDVIGNEFRGISITQSTDTLVAANYVANNGLRGVLLANSARVDVDANEIEDNDHGIGIEQRGGHTITRNRVRDNGVGLIIGDDAGGSLVYDNLFSNAQNANDVTGTNTWNVSRRAGPNVIGEDWIGGNYWSDLPDEIHDHDGDGLGEGHGPYANGIVQGGDYLPIMTGTAAPHADFSVDPASPLTLVNVTFTDRSAPGDAPLVNWSWKLGDGTVAYGSTVERVFERAGTYHVILQVRDAKGLTSRHTEAVRVENRPPVPAVDGAPRIVSPSLTVLLDGSRSYDPDGRIERWAWEFDDGESANGARTERTFAEDGEYAVSLLVVDDGAASAHLAVHVTVDTTPPTSTAIVDGTPGNAGWYASRATVRLDAHDAHAGVGRIEWRLRPDATWRTFGEPIELADGVHVLEHRAVDVAGHEEAPRAYVVRVDTTAPVTRLASGPDAGPEGRVALDATDATSGVARTLYRLPGDDAWREYAGPFRVPADTRDGNLTLLTRSVDVAGNVEAVRALTLVWDATPPEVAFDSPRRMSATANGVTLNAPHALTELPPEDVVLVIGEANVRVTATDAGSGVARVRLFVGDVLLAESVNGTLPEVTWRPDTEGYHVLRVEAVDAVGNTAAQERGVWAVPVPDAAGAPADAGHAPRAPASATVEREALRPRGDRA